MEDQEQEKIDAVIERIKLAYAALKKEKTHKYINKKFSIDMLAIPDIKYIKDLEDLELNIEILKKSLSQGESVRRVSARLGYGVNIVTYIARELGYEVNLEARAQRKEDYARKLEDIWRSYKAGEHIYKIAANYSCSVEETEIIIKNIEKRVESRRRKYKNLENFDEGQEREKLEKSMSFSDDILDYILYGTPVNLPREQDKIKQKNNLGDEGRDE